MFGKVRKYGDVALLIETRIHTHSQPFDYIQFLILVKKKKLSSKVLAFTTL